MKVQKTKQIFTIEDMLKSMIIAFIISFVIICFFRLTIVNGESMESTLTNQEKLILTKIVKNPKHGDIIVVKPEKINVDYIIKRVIAVPGDTVAIKDNIIYVNDVALEESSYIKEKMVTANIDRFQLKEDEYFICGDNRNNSLDSRSEILGPITKDEIFGKIILNLDGFNIY